MGYMTKYSLKWEPVDKYDDPTEPNCAHEKPKGAKFCPECGQCVGLTRTSNKIQAFLRENPDVYYAFDENGNPEEACRWYEHEDDLLTLSKQFPTYLFTLSGTGEQKEDMWKKYFLDGRIQEERARITIGEFDTAKLKIPRGGK